MTKTSIVIPISETNYKGGIFILIGPSVCGNAAFIAQVENLKIIKMHITKYFDPKFGVVDVYTGNVDINWAYGKALSVLNQNYAEVIDATEQVNINFVIKSCNKN